MKLSVVLNSTGEIVAASISGINPAPLQAVGPYAMDQLVLPSGHSVQELDMPPELAKALLEGNFSEAFQHYTLTKPTLSQT
jgi:hypothetical protein